jgi:predicted ester cyclase
MFSLIALGACEPSESHQSEQNRKQPAPNYSVARSTEPSLLPQDIVRAELAFNTRNMNKAVEFMVDQAVMLERSSDVQPIVGKANIQRHMEELVRAFPDATVTPYRIMGGNQWILSETHLHGSQSQPLGSLENNGRRFDVRGAKLYRVQAGHIVETRIYMDTPTVLKQLLQPRGLSVERTPRPNLLEPEMPTGPPDAELERRFVGFVKAWTSHSQRRVDQLVAHDIRFHNHAWHHEGHGLRRFMKEGAPLPWPLTHRGLDIVSTLSTGEWVAGEVLIS